MVYKAIVASIFLYFLLRGRDLIVALHGLTVGAMGMRLPCALLMGMRLPCACEAFCGSINAEVLTYMQDISMYMNHAAFHSGQRMSTVTVEHGGQLSIRFRSCLCMSD